MTDYVFVPSSDSMFISDGSHFTVGLSWSVQLMGGSTTCSNRPLRLRYLGQPDEELYLLGSPKRFQSVDPERFLIQ